MTHKVNFQKNEIIFVRENEWENWQERVFEYFSTDNGTTFANCINLWRPEKSTPWRYYKKYKGEIANK